MSHVSVDPPAKGQEAGWLQGVLLAAPICLLVLNASVMLPIIPQLARSASGAALGSVVVQFAVVAPTLTMALTSPLAGIIGDRLGRRRTLNVAACAFAGLAIIPYWLENLELIIVVRALTGVALGFMMSSAGALTGDYFEGARRQRWLSLQGAASGLTAILAAAVSGILAEANPQAPFLLLSMGLPVALALLICRGPDDEVIRPPSTAQAVAGAWAPRAIWPILASAAIASLILFPLGYVLGGLLEEEALGGSALTGLAIAVLSAGGMVGALLLNVMARLGPADKQALAFVLAAGGLLCVSAVGTEEVLLLGAFAVGLGQGMTMPVFSHWILDASPPELRGRAVGLFQITFFLAQFAAPLAAQATVQAVGSTGGGLLWYAVANLLAFGILSVARIVNARAFTP